MFVAARVLVLTYKAKEFCDGVHRAVVIITASLLLLKGNGKEKVQSFPQYNDNKTHDLNSSVMCLKSTSQFSRRVNPASLITFRYGVDCVLTGVHLRQHTVSDSLFQSLTHAVSMGRLCDILGPHEGSSRKIKSENKISRRLEKNTHNSKSSKLFRVVT